LSQTKKKGIPFKHSKVPKQAIREGVNQKAHTGMGYGIGLILRLESGIWLEIYDKPILAGAYFNTTAAYFMRTSVNNYLCH